MKLTRYALPLAIVAAAGLMSVSSRQAEAASPARLDVQLADFSIHGGRRGSHWNHLDRHYHSDRYWHGHSGHRRSYYGRYDTGYYDWYPGYYTRHHYHYVPRHYDHHRGRHYDYHHGRHYDRHRRGHGGGRGHHGHH